VVAWNVLLVGARKWQFWWHFVLLNGSSAQQRGAHRANADSPFFPVYCLCLFEFIFIFQVLLRGKRVTGFAFLFFLY
jgi:hypothetical protein